jgi:hypothetical protein
MRRNVRVSGATGVVRNTLVLLRRPLFFCFVFLFFCFVNHSNIVSATFSLNHVRSGSDLNSAAWVLAVVIFLPKPSEPKSLPNQNQSLVN